MIAGYRALIDPHAIGLGITAFVEITLERQNDDTLRAFESGLAACPNVLTCHLMSGSSDYLVQIVARDLPDFERLHANVLGHLPGVARIESKFALREGHRPAAGTDRVMLTTTRSSPRKRGPSL